MYFTNWLYHHWGMKTTIKTTWAIWSKPLYARCPWTIHGTPPLHYDQSHHFVPYALLLASSSWRHLSNISRLHKFWKTWYRRVFYKLVKSLSSTPLCKESVHRNHAGTIGHCDVTIAGGQLLYRWHHNRSTFWIIGSSDGTNLWIYVN